MMKIVGYEGGRRTSICTYAACAILNAQDELYNSCLPTMRSKDGEKELEKYSNKGTITLLEVPIELPDQMIDAVYPPYFVFDMPLDIAQREPYSISSEKTASGRHQSLMTLMYGYVASAYGATRAYHAFQSMEKLQKWLVSLHIGNRFVMKEY